MLAKAGIGGLAANLARVMPHGLAARVDRALWEPAPVFSRIAGWGSVPQLDLEGTLNMGIGMVALVFLKETAGASLRGTEIPSLENDFTTLQKQKVN